MKKVIIGSIKVLSFILAFTVYLLNIKYQYQDFSVVYYLLVIFIFSIGTQLIIFANKANKSNFRSTKFILSVLEFAIAIIGYFWFQKYHQFDAILFLWLIPLFLRWYLPEIFKLIHFLKKRST